PREAERAVGEGIERHVEREGGRGPGMPSEPRATGGELPAVPRDAVDAGAHVDPERVERAPERRDYARRAGERPVRPGVWIGARRGVALHEPGHQGIDGAQAVGGDIER